MDETNNTTNDFETVKDESPSVEHTADVVELEISERAEEPSDSSKTDVQEEQPGSPNNVQQSDDEEDDKQHSDEETEGLLNMALSLSSEKKTPAAPKIKERVRMSNARKKRFKWHLKQGCSVEEARRLSLEKMPHRGESNTFKIEGGPVIRDARQIINDKIASQPKKAKEIPKKEGIVGRPKLSANSQRVPGSVRIGIMPYDYPRKTFTQAQLEDLEETLMDVILERRAGPLKPHFFACRHKAGWMMLLCKGNQTVAWLNDNLYRLNPFQGVEIRLVNKADLPTKKIVTARFPQSAEHDTPKIWGLIEGQNDLDTSAWYLLSRNNDRGIARLTITVDDMSFEKLRQRNFLINYRYGEVRFWGKKIRSSSFMNKFATYMEREAPDEYMSQDNIRPYSDSMQQNPYSSNFQRDAYTSYGRPNSPLQHPQRMNTYRSTDHQDQFWESKRTIRNDMAGNGRAPKRRRVMDF